MKCVVLDGYTLNPGDLDWGPLRELTELTVHDRTPPGQTLARSKGAPVIMTNKTVLDRNIIGQLPGLRYIGVLATGYNIVDTGAAAEAGITVTNVPGYGTSSVAQSVFALLLELTNSVALHSRSVQAGGWSASPDFCYSKTTLTELSGLTMGIVGYGAIGRETAEIARAFGMRVLVFDIHGVGSAEFTDLDDLLANSDVVSLHCPLTESNTRMINRDSISLMKKSALLINTARGPLVHEQDLADALNSGRIAGAGLDVLTKEPPESDNPLLSAKNCVITPHISWATGAARERLMHTAVENLRAWISGFPVNVVGAV